MRNRKIDRIIEVTAAYYYITPEELTSESRKIEHCLPRHMAITCIKENLKMGVSAIGRYFGLDHSTIINAIKKTTQDHLRQDQLKELLELTK